MRGEFPNLPPKWNAPLLPQDLTTYAKLWYAIVVFFTNGVVCDFVVSQVVWSTCAAMLIISNAPATTVHIVPSSLLQCLVDAIV